MPPTLPTRTRRAKAPTPVTAGRERRLGRVWGRLTWGMRRAGPDGDRRGWRADVGRAGEAGDAGGPQARGRDHRPALADRGDPGLGDRAAGAVRGVAVGAARGDPAPRAPADRAHAAGPRWRA